MVDGIVLHFIVKLVDVHCIAQLQTTQVIDTQYVALCWIAKAVVVDAHYIAQTALKWLKHCIAS